MSYVQQIDWEKTLVLIDASIQAYHALESKPKPPEAPPGYEILDTWTGFDAVFGEDRTEDVYGVTLRSTEAPNRYVFAFRGTSSVMDMLEDLGVEKRGFRPFEPSAAVPPEVEVESGFFDVYAQGDGDKPSMQAQVFALLDRYASSERPVDELWITGHSLGSALSELFSLDVALSRPNITASNVNFACPRVGNDEFVAFYEQQPAQRDPRLRTVRVQNVHDKVPCLPPESMGFKHVADAFLVSFHKHGWFPDLGFIVHNHASANYQAVLECAAASPGKVCVQKTLDVPGEDYALTSQPPDPSDVCALF